MLNRQARECWMCWMLGVLGGKDGEARRSTGGRPPHQTVNILRGLMYDMLLELGTTSKPRGL